MSVGDAWPRGPDRADVEAARVYYPTARDAEPDWLTIDEMRWGGSPLEAAAALQLEEWGYNPFEL